MRFARHRGRGTMDGLTNALIGAAAADVAAHSIVDISVGGVGLLVEQRHGGHNLARLAVSALRNVFFHPSLLDRMAAIGREAFDGGDFLSGDAGDGGDTGTCGFAVDMDGTSPA